MGKTDLRKELRELYDASPGEITVVDVPRRKFLMVDGAGHPEATPEFQEALGALYSLSYTLKFMLKKTQGVDYTVMPLEGLWWTEDGREFSMDNRGAWKWTVMIMQPDCVTGEAVAEATEQVRRKRSLPALSRVRFEEYHEGLAAQVMHIGPYGEEGPTIARLHSYIREHGYMLAGKHHEIYLGDPRRTAPEKLRTLLRQPIREEKGGERCRG